METVTPEDRLKNRGGLLQQLKRMERASNTAEKKVSLSVGFGKLTYVSHDLTLYPRHHSAPRSENGNARRDSGS